MSNKTISSSVSLQQKLLLDIDSEEVCWLRQSNVHQT